MVVRDARDGYLMTTLTGLWAVDGLTRGIPNVGEGDTYCEKVVGPTDHTKQQKIYRRISLGVGISFTLQMSCFCCAETTRFAKDPTSPRNHSRLNINWGILPLLFNSIFSSFRVDFYLASHVLLINKLYNFSLSRSQGMAKIPSKVSPRP